MGSNASQGSRTQESDARLAKEKERMEMEERQKEIKAVTEREQKLKQEKVQEEEKEKEKKKEGEKGEKEKEKQIQLVVSETNSKVSVNVDDQRDVNNVDKFQISQQNTITSEYQKSLRKSLNIDITFEDSINPTNIIGCTPLPIADSCVELIEEYGEFLRNETQGECKTELKPGVLLHDQSYYEGQWNQKEKDNKIIYFREGYGKQIFPDGSIFEGYFKNDMREGKGRLIEANKNMYNGKWKDNQMDGLGYYSKGNMIHYEGEFKQNEPKGKGTIVNLNDSTTYEGEVNGWHEKQGIMKHGLGKLIRKDKRDSKGNYSYEGSYKNGLRDGKGAKYICEDENKIYVGEFKGDQLTGEGELETKRDSGIHISRYKGQFLNGEKEGYGVLDDGIVKYSGQFHKNRKHGEGELQQGLTITKGIWVFDILQK